MFIGSYEHNIDGKNRLFVPAKFREELGENVIYKVMMSKHPSIQLYSKDEFEKSLLGSLENIANEDKKRIARARIYMGAGEASYDAQGRIIINPAIAKRAGIEKQCVFVGFGNYVEIMSPETYDSYLEDIYSDNIAEEESIAREADVYRSLQAEGKFITLPESSL